MKDNREFLNAFLGEANDKTIDFQMSTDFRLTEQQFCSESKLDHTEVEESMNTIQKESIFSPNSPMRTSINFQMNNDSSSSESYQHFYNSDNVFLDFLDILRVQGIDDPCVQYYFNQIFSALLAFKPETVQSLALEKHENGNLLKYAYKYIGDFDIADVIEKICFQLYEPSENVSLTYLKQRENQVIKIMQELLDMITIDMDEFDLQSICRIITHCLTKSISHHHSHTFLQFSNFIFTHHRVVQYIHILVNSKSQLVVCEISNLFIAALKLISHSTTVTQSENDAKATHHQSYHSNSIQFNKEWLEIVVNSLRIIKERRLDVIDSSRTVMTQFEQTIQIFGKEKLSIIDLIFELVRLNDPFVIQQVIMQDYPQEIFNSLFTYEWNNLLHEKVYWMIDYLVKQVLDSNKSSNRDSPVKDAIYSLLIHFVSQVEIYKHIRKNSTDETITLTAKQIVLKKPNIAFVIKIAESLETLRTNVSEVDEMFDKIQREKWTDFCQNFLKCKLDLQKVNLGEYDKQKDIIQSQSSGFGREINKSRNQSKLAERMRKHSGKDMSLFILNPSNKKFSTNSADPISKSQNINQKQHEFAPQSSSATPKSAQQMTRKKLINLEDEEQKEGQLSAGRKKLSISVERKHASSIQSGNQNYNLNSMNLSYNQEKENDNKLIQGESQTNIAEKLRKQSDILDHLDDSWETSTKRIITLGSYQQGGICYDETSQKNKQNSNSVQKITQNDQLYNTDSHFIMFKTKTENNETKVTSFGARIMENLNIKKKKFSYDEQNSSQFLLSPRIFLKKKRVKSQPNLQCPSFFDQQDESVQEQSSKYIFDNISKGNSFPSEFTQTAFSSETSSFTQQFRTIKIQPSCLPQSNNIETDTSPHESPKPLNIVEKKQLSKKFPRPLQLKQSNSLKESHFDNTNDGEEQQADSLNKLLTLNRQALKINLNLKKSASLTKQNRINIQNDQKSTFTKINEEENDSQSETELSNSKSADSKSGSPIQSQKNRNIQIQQSDKDNNDKIVQKLDYTEQVDKNQTRFNEQVNNDCFWLLTQSKADSQGIMKEFEMREQSISWNINEKVSAKQQLDESSISDLLSTNYKQQEGIFSDFVVQKGEDNAGNTNNQRRRKESIYEYSEFLSGQMYSPICQILNKDETLEINNKDDYEYDGYEQTSSILSQHQSINISLNKYYPLDKPSIQDSQEVGQQNQQARQHNKKELFDTKQQSFVQNDTSFSMSIALENDKSKQLTDCSLNQETSFIL